jgi:DNA-binding response OmpR family regulator
MINNNTIYNILLVTDSFDSETIVQKNTNYKFIQANNKEDIITILENNNITLIVFDIELYGFDFINILFELKKILF